MGDAGSFTLNDTGSFNERSYIISSRLGLLRILNTRARGCSCALTVGIEIVSMRKYAVLAYNEVVAVRRCVGLGEASVWSVLLCHLCLTGAWGKAGPLFHSLENQVTYGEGR